MAVSQSSLLSRSFLSLFILLASLKSWSDLSDQDLSDASQSGEADQVYGLPGQPPVSFRHYAGNIKLRLKDGKSFFYWFFEAEEGASEKPLVLWLSFGPGCSSVAFGAAQEMGPFLVQRNPSMLLSNKFSWNKVANILFMEAPIGVGFSYSNNSQDLVEVGDEITAGDSLAFLMNWFERFPKFKSNDFYIAGESYAGHFAPQLAGNIYDQNWLASKNNNINLKGIMFGNAEMNQETDSDGMLDYSWSHGILSDELYHTLKVCFPEAHNETIEGCRKAIAQWFHALGEIDAFSIHTPTCLLEHDLLMPSSYDPCKVNYVFNYFNREDVQKALHANVTKLPYPYTPCRVFERWHRAPKTILPVISKLIKLGLRIWIYSGDTDARVPLTSTRYSINEMRLKVKKEWRSWFHNHQVGGWVVEYEGLTFVTVKGAGHFVPLKAPGEVLSIVSHFLSGAPLPSSRF